MPLNAYHGTTLNSDTRGQPHTEPHWSSCSCQRTITWSAVHFSRSLFSPFPERPSLHICALQSTAMSFPWFCGSPFPAFHVFQIAQLGKGQRWWEWWLCAGCSPTQSQRSLLVPSEFIAHFPFRKLQLSWGRILGPVNSQAALSWSWRGLWELGSGVKAKYPDKTPWSEQILGNPVVREWNQGTVSQVGILGKLPYP